MINKIIIYEDSVILHDNYIGDDKWERTLAFPRGGVTYLISNGTIKFYAYEDYLYRNCLISMRIPLHIVDEYMHVDDEYDDIQEITRILDRVFPTNDIDAQLEKYLKIQDAELIYQPIGDYLTKVRADTYYQPIGDYVTDEELVEVLDDYYTKTEVDSELSDKQDVLISGTSIKTINNQSLLGSGNINIKGGGGGTEYIAGDGINITNDVISVVGKVDTSSLTSNYYSKTQSDSRFQPVGNYATQSWTNSNFHNKSYIDSLIISLQNRIGELETAFADCCSYTPTYEYRWTEVAGEYVCGGYDKYAKEVKQQSSDGITWENVIPEQSRQGRLIETDSSYCGYITGYTNNYLTFEAIDSGTFSFEKGGTGNDIQYSLDNGVTWTSLASNANTPTVSAGSKILWKADLTPDLNSGTGRFSSTGRFNVEGNVMSLLYGDNFIGQTSLSGKYGAFTSLFSECTHLVSAENLSLPATTLEAGCYSGMFKGCASLTTAPSLPATTLGYWCYCGMFRDCTSLTTAPVLSATTLSQYCYDSMFRGCTSLTTAPELPAETLPVSCYSYMFSGCTSLTTAAALPAETLTERCYAGMFWGCTSLTTAPSLPATTLAERCYYHMFYNCSSLTTAPELPAETLANGCYEFMFENCSNLNYIKCLATDISASICTIGWVRNVASSGTFVKPSGMNDWTTGDYGIPSGWTVQNI